MTRWNGDRNSYHLAILYLEERVKEPGRVWKRDTTGPGRFKTTPSPPSNLSTSETEGNLKNKIKKKSFLSPEQVCQLAGRYLSG